MADAIDMQPTYSEVGELQQIHITQDPYTNISTMTCITYVMHSKRDLFYLGPSAPRGSKELHIARKTAQGISMLPLLPATNWLSACEGKFGGGGDSCRENHAWVSGIFRETRRLAVLPDKSDTATFEEYCGGYSQGDSNSQGRKS